MSPQIFRGIGVSPGIAVGKALVIEVRRPRVKREVVDPAHVSSEVARLQQALEVSRRQILEIQERIAKEVGPQYARIFDAHLLILEDRTLAEQASAVIQNEKVNVEYAVQEVLDPVRQALSRVEDGYLRERRTDVDDVGDRLLRNLLGQRGSFQVEGMRGEVIVFAHGEIYAVHRACDAVGPGKQHREIADLEQGSLASGRSAHAVSSECGTEAVTARESMASRANV
jgi:phosphotransferase system enzyme I (PtsI)